MRDYRDGFLFIGHPSFGKVIEDLTDMELIIERDRSAIDIEDVPQAWCEHYRGDIANEILERGL